MKRRIEKIQSALQGLKLQDQAKKERDPIQKASLEKQAIETLHGIRKEANSITKLIKSGRLGPVGTIQEKDLESLLNQGIL